MQIEASKLDKSSFGAFFLHKLTTLLKMEKFSQNFIQKTIEVWQPYSEAPLSLEDAREIAENMTGLFSFLIELERKYGKE